MRPTMLTDFFCAIFWAIALFPLIIGCDDAPVGELTASTALSVVEGHNHPEHHAKPLDGSGEIHIGLSAAFVSERGVNVYEKLVEYLTDKTELECELVSGLSYDTLNEMLKGGVLDVGFICGLPYVLQQEEAEPRTRLMAAPIMSASHYRGQPKYFSYVVVRHDSAIRSFADLKGHSYAFNDELSNSGYNLPRARLVELGETKGFFSRVERSGSHEESIRMVADGVVEASSVDSLVFDYELSEQARYARKLRIVERLGPSGICPVVASVRLDEARFQKIQAALIGMEGDPRGRLILRDAFVAEFVETTNDNYDDIREQLNKAREAGYMTIK